MLGWNIYWVESEPSENCFVVARTARSAAKHEEDVLGLEPKSAKATLVMPLRGHTLQAWAAAEKRLGHTNDFFSALQNRLGYADESLLEMMGAQLTYQDGGKVVILNGKNIELRASRKPTTAVGARSRAVNICLKTLNGYRRGTGYIGASDFQRGH